MSKEHAVAALTIDGCNLSVLVVGPVGGDARRYARAIDTWRAGQGFKGDVPWSIEKDRSSATYNYRPGQFGSTHATTIVDLHALRSALIAVEPHMQIAVIDNAWSKAEIALAPDATSSKGIRYWNLTNMRPGLTSATGSVTVKSWMPVLLIPWILVLQVGLAYSSFLAVTIRRRQEIRHALQRKFYRTVDLGGGCVLVAGLGLTTVSDRTIEPLSQLWFGKRFDQVVLSVSPLFAVIVILGLVALNRVEKRLIEPSEEEEEETLQPTSVTSSRPVLPRQRRFCADSCWF